jgi:hypothetical protein
VKKQIIQLLLLLALLMLASGCAAASGGDKVVLGGNEVLRSGEVLNGNLAVFGGNMRIEEEAIVAGDVSVFGGNLMIDGTVQGDIAVFGGNLQRAPGAVLGKVVVMGGADNRQGQTVTPPPPPVIPEVPEPPVAPAPPPPPVAQVSQPSVPDRLFGIIGNIVETFLKIVALGVLGLVMALFLPDHVRRVGRAAGEAPAASAAVGCLALPAVVLGVVVAAITIVGIPLAILLPFLLAAAVIFGWIGIGFYFGDRLLRSAEVRSPRPAAATAIGAGSLVMVSSVAGVVPVLGWLVGPLLAIWGLGATILTRGGTRSYPMRPVRIPVEPPVPPLTFDPLDEIEPAPRSRAARGNDLFADLAADLGIEEELYEQENADEDERPRSS